MPFFPTLAPDAGVPQIYKAYPRTYQHWVRMGEEVMTKEAPLSQGERELIATYVSSLNGCEYCRAAHLPSMRIHGIEKKVVDALVQDIDTAPVEEKLKPIFALAKKLTLEPAGVRREDTDAVLSAGWDEEALHSAVGVVCRFNFMNRLVMAHGLVPPDEGSAMENAQRRREHGYSKMHTDL